MPIAVLLTFIDSDKIKLLKYYTSGDISGDYSNAVGYASIVFYWKRVMSSFKWRTRALNSPVASWKVFYLNKLIRGQDLVLPIELMGLPGTNGLLPRKRVSDLNWLLNQLIDQTQYDVIRVVANAFQIAQWFHKDSACLWIADPLP